MIIYVKSFKSCKSKPNKKLKILKATSPAFQYHITCFSKLSFYNIKKILTKGSQIKQES